MSTHTIICIYIKSLSPLSHCPNLTPVRLYGYIQGQKKVQWNQRKLSQKLGLSPWNRLNFLGRVSDRTLGLDSVTRTLIPYFGGESYTWKFDIVVFCSTKIILQFNVPVAISSQTLDIYRHILLRHLKWLNTSSIYYKAFSIRVKINQTLLK